MYTLQGNGLITKAYQVLTHELQTYLHEHIPLSKAMAVSVVQVATNHVLLSAPLAPNINHRDTVFGGSASALAILAAWSLLHTRMRDENISARLVIRRNTMEYERPIVGEFTARAWLETPEQWPHFTHMLARKGKARIIVLSALEYAGQIAGRFRGEFVALATSG